MLTVPRRWCPFLLPRPPGIRVRGSTYTLERSPAAQILAWVACRVALFAVVLCRQQQVCAAALQLEAYARARDMLYPKQGGRPSKKKACAVEAGASALSACVVFVWPCATRLLTVPMSAGGLAILLFIYIMDDFAITIHETMPELLLPEKKTDPTAPPRGRWSNRGCGLGLGSAG